MGFNDDYMQYEQLKADCKVLEKKLANMRESVNRRQNQIETFRYTVEKEKHDYDVLINTSMKQLIAKITGNYEDKLDKEYREYIAVKQSLDEMMYQLECANQDVLKLENQIITTKEKITQMLREIKSRYQYSDESKYYNEALQKLLCSKKEYQEAISAVINTRQHADEVARHLNNASSASTWDMLGGELFADILKYSSLDKVGAAVSAMKSAALNMKTELNDINIDFDVQMDYIDGRTRTFDVFFDNFFSDIQVRDRINNNVKIINDYINKLIELEYRLNTDLALIDSEIQVWNEQLTIM